MAKDERRGDPKKAPPSTPSSERAGPVKASTKAGILAHNAAFTKSTVDSARALPETEIRPPSFLSPLEAMTDIYMRTRGRMSPKTKELLQSTDLEDLLEMLVKLHTSEELLRRAEARLLHPIWSKLKDDPGPLLLGLNDKRLTEPWRLLLDRWDIWVPSDAEKGGVELFWEGEGEDEDGEAIEILQSLSFQIGELTLHAKLGKAEDRITFDGAAFYRLKPRPGDGA